VSSFLLAQRAGGTSIPFLVVKGRVFLETARKEGEALDVFLTADQHFRFFRQDFTKDALSSFLGV